MAVSTIPKTYNAFGGIISGGASMTLNATHFLGAFSFGGNFALINAVESSIVFLLNTNSPVTCSYNNGVYTFTNTMSSYGLRYHIITGDRST